MAASSDLPPVDWLLALDVSTRATGWAAGRIMAPNAHVGLWELPGMKDQGVLYGTFRDKLAAWCDRRLPELVVYVRPFMNKGSIAAEGLGGMCAILHLFCHDRKIPLRRIDEGDARVAILRPTILSEMARASRAAGKGSGAGSKLVKAAALEWAAARGIDVKTHDVADAAIVWTYTRGLINARQQPRAA